MPVSAAKPSAGARRREMVEHADQEARLARGGANLGRADAGHGEEAAEPLGSPAMKVSA